MLSAECVIHTACKCWLTFSFPEIRLSCVFGSSIILLKNMYVCKRKANMGYHLIEMKIPTFRLQELFLRLRPDYVYIFFSA